MVLYSGSERMFCNLNDKIITNTSSHTRVIERKYRRCCKYIRYSFKAVHLFDDINIIRYCAFTTILTRLFMPVTKCSQTRNDLLCVWYEFYFCQISTVWRIPISPHGLIPSYISFFKFRLGIKWSQLWTWLSMKEL